MQKSRLFLVVGRIIFLFCSTMIRVITVRSHSNSFIHGFIMMVLMIVFRRLITNARLLIPKCAFTKNLSGLHNIKEWNHQAKSIETSRKQEVMRKLTDIEEKINSNTALDSEKDDRVKLLKERDDIQQLEDMDLMQKARVKCDVEGDEIKKLFYVKTTFCNFYKNKFDNSDSSIDLFTLTPQSTINHNDNLELEKNISDDEIRLAIWDCGSQKAPGLDRFSFLFLKKYWELLKEDVMKAMRGVFVLFVMPKELLPKSWQIGSQKSLRKWAPHRVKNMVSSGLIQGASIGDSGYNLSYLFYADGVVIILEWNRQDMINIIHVLHVFYLASCLKINVSKSKVYGLGVNPHDIKVMACDTWCGSGIVPFSYLVLPLGANMNLISNWQPLVDHFRAKLSTWKASTLSIGGRVTHIKLVLGSLGIYYMSIFKCPETVLNSLAAMRASIFWGESQEIVDSFKGILVTWKYITEQPKKGGDEYNERRYIILKFDHIYKDSVLTRYLPSIIEKVKHLKNQKKAVKLFNLECEGIEGVNLDHPPSFDTRDFYKKVGKVLKRGYLLYGPPGIGKSSLIAAMANYLKFDVYDLQLMNIRCDSNLKDMMLQTSNRSILMIEDIDCSTNIPDQNGTTPPNPNPVVILREIEELIRCKKVTPAEVAEELIKSDNAEVVLEGLVKFLEGKKEMCRCNNDERDQ
ncbi:RNA-directed DNA polymerase, eukaryota, reverse transcriptase zinc-binding domain protein [Tanacetum coccineum]